MLRSLIKTDLEKAVKELGYKPTDIVLSISQNPSFGDYSSNVALQLSKLGEAIGNQSPVEIANRIVNEFYNVAENSKSLKKVEVAENGFINFWLKDD